MYWVGRFLLFEGRSDMAREHNKFKDFVTEYPWIIMLATVIIAAFLILLIVSISARRQRTLISKIKICLVGYAASVLRAFVSARQPSLPSRIPADPVRQSQTLHILPRSFLFLFPADDDIQCPGTGCHLNTRFLVLLPVSVICRKQELCKTRIKHPCQTSIDQHPLLYPHGFHKSRCKVLMLSDPSATGIGICPNALSKPLQCRHARFLALRIMSEELQQHPGILRLVI